MPFKLIKGEFVPEAGNPDGDSLRFRPDDPTPLFELTRRGRAPRVNTNNGTIQLRYEGIDTMESKAAEPYSSEATQSNLELAGVPSGTGTSRGYIMSSQTGPNGRPIAFAFSGDAPESDGDDVFLTVDRMKKSINFEQLVRGHAYPLFYDTLFADLRDAMGVQAAASRSDGVKVWSADVTNSGATYSGSDSLATMPPIFPKLWRRLDRYSTDRDVMDPSSLDEFKEYLESLREERVFITSERLSTGFDNVVKVDGNKVRLEYQPEDMVIVSVGR